LYGLDPRYRALMSDDAALKAAEPANPSATMTGQLGLYELRSGDVLANRFRIVAMLGIGGMGVVYRALDQSLDVEVAIKLLRPELARRPESFERFRQELLLARQVSSPHVVRIHDIAEHDGRWFISMDFIDGVSLEHRLDRSGKLPTEDVIRITHDLLDGLVAAQQRGVVHRDLKPANILLDAQDHAYITDFGVARSLGATGITHSGVIIGTPEYLSPEQARGENVDARSDLYAVGLILYEMLAGELPFTSGTPAETVMQRIVRQPPSLSKVRPDLPGWLHAFSDRLLKLNPTHRFASAREALRALETRKVSRQPINRHVWLAAAFLIVALAGTIDWIANRPPALLNAVPANASTAQWASLPIAASRPELAGAARAIDEHLNAWLRTDNTIAVIPRRRVEQAIARTAPDATADSLARLGRSVANAAGAAHWLHGDVTTQGDDLVLQLSVDGAGPASALLIVRGHDAPSLFDAYLKQASDYLAHADVHVGAPPAIASASVDALGAGLIALDKNRPADAAKTLAGIVEHDRGSALVASATLQAEEQAHQQLPAQNTREAIVPEFSSNKDPFSSELVANALSGNGDDEKAERVLAQAMQAYPHDAALTLAYADILRQRGAGEKASNLLKDYLKNADDDARAWFLLGRIAIGQGKPSDAVEQYLLHAQTLNILAHDSAAEAETRNAIGIGYERLGQLDAAAEQYQRAVVMREKLDDKEGLAKSLRNLAIVQAEQGKRAEAEQTLTRVSGLLESLGDRASIADLYNDRGVVAEEAGDFAEALKYYRQAYALRQQLDNPTAIAESLNNIGFCSYRMGDFDNASVYWKQAMEQYTKLDDHNGMLHIQQSTGLLDIARGQFALAQKDLSQSLDYAENHQLPEEAAVANVSLAELSLLEGRYTAAQAFVDQAAKIFARRADERGNAETALLKARIAIALGDRDGSRKLLDAIDQKQLNDEQSAEFQIADAQQAALADDKKTRASKLDEAAKSADRAHSGALKTRVDLERVRLALSTNDTSRAETLMKQIREQGLSLNDVPVRLSWLELETALALRNGNTTAAVENYRAALPLLKTAATYAQASTLHGMGEAALANDPAQRGAAHSAAVAENKRLMDDAPAQMRDSLKSELARRWHEENGRGDVI
jgi:tetratricopeptide (TPR) repeat protein